MSGGCKRPAGEKVGQQPARDKPNEQIPLSIAGTWQMRDGVWRMTIEPNGIVSSVIHPSFFEREVRPHQTTEVEMLDGNFSSVECGDFFAEYNQTDRNLFVSIEVNAFHIRFYEIRWDGPGGVGPAQVDRFEGPVSEDGKVWVCDWINVFDYGPDFPQDPNDIEPSGCIFDKVEEYKPPEEAKKAGG